MFNLDIIKNLYYVYFFLKLNCELEKNYIIIIYNEVFLNVFIWIYYNDLIFKNFLNELVIKVVFI